MASANSALFKASINPSIVLRPLYSGKVSAGQSRFPSAAQDYELEELDLNKRYITNPPATFMMKVAGDSMIGIGIYPGTVLIVDRSAKVKSTSIIVAVLDGELIVKRFYKRGAVIKLLSENPAHKPIQLVEGQELTVWGVVTYFVNAAI